jgi:hypothetical protein
MPRKQRGGRKSKPKDTQQPRKVSTDWRNLPSAQAVADKIARGGKSYFEDNFERIMIDAFALAEEPEFSDLYFDHEKTGTVTARIGRKFEKQFDAARKKGEDEAHQVYDEMRIEIVDALATPAFRKEVFRRLEQLANRLAGTADAGKLETAFILGSMLRMKKLPWGICGLILAIYDRTLERGRRKLEEARSVMQEVLELIGPDQDPETVLSTLQDPGHIGELTEKLAARPELRQRLERQFDKMVEEFERALWTGEARLDLFTQEEIQLPFHRMQEKIEAENVDISTADPQKTTQDLIQFMRNSLAEIITPERFREIKASFQRVLQQWQREKNKWALPLQVEIGWLDDYKVEENTFLLAAYVAQIRRHMKSQGSGERQHGRSTPSKRRGLVSRARRLFRKEDPGES